MTRRALLNIAVTAPLAKLASPVTDTRPPLHDRMEAAFKDVLVTEPLDTVKEYSLAVKDVDAFDTFVDAISTALDRAESPEKRKRIIGWAIVCSIQIGREVGKGD